MNKMPGVKHIAERLDRSSEGAGLFTTGAGLFVAQDDIPIWNSIVGTAIPSSGSSRLLLYVSDDGESYNRRIRFDIDSNGNITTTRWNTSE